MPRMMLTDADWSRLSSLLQLSGRVYNKAEHRLTLEGILYRLRTGCPWRDLPAAFGHWNTVFRRFNLWSKKGVLSQL
ncbi:transposase, partial [Methylohalomonas lacus]